MLSVEELGNLNLKVYQDDKLYRFTSDAILLSRFATVKKGDNVADFCAGSGIVGFNLYGLNPEIKNLTFFEMQKPLFDLSVKSIALNGLENKFFAENCRVQDIDKKYNGVFSLVVCNPPYAEVGKGFKDENEHIAACRTEINLTLSELVLSAARALKFGGRFTVVHRADRLADIIAEMKNKNIEPKKLQFVSGKNKPPYLVLIEGVKGGKSGLKVLRPIENQGEICCISSQRP